MRLPLFATIALLAAGVAGADPCRSGPRVNQRPGPYISVVSTGQHRGQSHCFICEAADKPVVIIFARHLSDPLGKLVGKIDKALARHKDADLRAWVTFLAEDQTVLDPKVVDWSQRHAIGKIPLGVFDDTVGPPSYLLHRDADVTVLLSVKQKVAFNFAYRAGELNDAAIGEIMKALPRIAAAAKK
ncbi:MAG: hypothetical protein FJ271_14890 [Planctomycetes bacterium]|nr:hypothetical protein [Planctomycetota bacterium]